MHGPHPSGGLRMLVRSATDQRCMFQPNLETMLAQYLIFNSASNGGEKACQKKCLWRFAIRGSRCEISGSSIVDKLGVDRRLIDRQEL